MENHTPQHKTGRNIKLNPAKNRYVFYLTDEENNRFLSLFEQSGMQIKSHFIAHLLFNNTFKVVKIDKNASDYYMRLTSLFAQFRAVGTNYNQVVKALMSNFSEKKALAFLYKLEQATRDLVEINRQVIALTHEFETRWLQK